MALKLIRLLGATGLLFINPPSLNADLNNYTFSIIRTAFMNGCVYMLNSDLEIIKHLKENPYEIKRYVENQAIFYMTEVSRLNNKKDIRAEPASSKKREAEPSQFYTHYNH